MSGADTTRSPRVTVIMNCYNGQRYLREAIESVLTQEFTDFEIVFWDNQSEDDSPDIVASYQDSRVRYFRAPCLTPLGEARNLAIGQARGDYIAFLDVDDVWLPDALSRLTEGMEDGNHMYAVCYGGYEAMDCAGRVLHTVTFPVRCGSVLGAMLRQFEIMPCSVMVRRSALIESGLNFDPLVSASEEYCLFMQLAVRYPFHSMDRVLARYRIHGGALTNASSKKWALEWGYTLSRIQRGFPDVVAEHAQDFRQAEARVFYYRASHLMSLGLNGRARQLLWRSWFVAWRYCVLAVLSCLPLVCWRYVHRVFHRRGSVM